MGDPVGRRRLGARAPAGRSSMALGLALMLAATLLATPWAFSTLVGEGGVPGTALTGPRSSSAASPAAPLTPPGSPTSGFADAPGVLAHPSVTGVSVSPSPAAVDSGQTLTLTAVATGASGPVSYQWYSGGSAPCNSNSAISGANTSTLMTTPISAPSSYCVVAMDSSGVAASSPLDTVSVSPSLGTPTLSPSSPSVDRGQSVSFTAAWTGGTPGFAATLFSVSGSPAACSNLVQSMTTPAGGPRTATFAPVAPPINTSYCVLVSDSSVGDPPAFSSSPIDPLTVGPAPTISTPTSSPRSSTDVGEAISFSTTVSGGLAPVSVSWGGLPPGCASVDSLSLFCAYPTTPGSYSIQAIVTDSNRAVAVSAPLSFSVFSSPGVGVPSFSPATIDRHQTTVAAVGASGGSGNLTFAWEGLPTGCTGTTPTFNCTPAISGTFPVSVVVTDPNGVSVTSSTTDLVVNAPITVYVADPGDPSGSSEAFAAVSSGGTAPVTIAWAFGDGTGASGATTSHDYGHGGTFTVSLWANDSLGGSSNQSWVVRIAPPTSATSLLGLPIASLPLVIGLIALGQVLGLVAIQVVNRQATPGRANLGRLT
ncbi:MAG TPA: PKD domain-containing protein, partial [Thermoplasmata archaeon]|nr:PKD domain-containing protein [Thermoplasmata archaeon]